MFWFLVGFFIYLSLAVFWGGEGKGAGVKEGRKGRRSRHRGIMVDKGVKGRIHPINFEKLPTLPSPKKNFPSGKKI